jgi:2-dehydropantoate 2-reductase
MLQDYESGRQPELEAICAAVLELASMQSIDMPLIRYISSLARCRSDAARSIAS